MGSRRNPVHPATYGNPPPLHEVVQDSRPVTPVCCGLFRSCLRTPGKLHGVQLVQSMEVFLFAGKTPPRGGGRNAGSVPSRNRTWSSTFAELRASTTPTGRRVRRAGVEPAQPEGRRVTAGLARQCAPTRWSSPTKKCREGCPFRGPPSVFKTEVLPTVSWGWSFPAGTRTRIWTFGGSDAIPLHHQESGKADGPDPVGRSRNARSRTLCGRVGACLLSQEHIPDDPSRRKRSDDDGN